MKPKDRTDNQHDLFRSRLDQQIDLNHPLVRAAAVIPWEKISDEVVKLFPSDRGRPALPTRLMAGLLMLKHAKGLSDEVVVETWLENPYWQYFCGEEYLQTRLPIDPSSLTRWRKRLDEAGCEELLAALIEAAIGAKLIERRDLKSVVVDTTVQEKAVKHPVDSWLLDRARRHVVAAADKAGIVLRQGYPRVGRRLLHQAQRYGHAGQYKRMGKVVKQLRNLLGRVIRDVARKLEKPQEQYPALSATLDKARRLFFQRRDDKDKLYSLHAPEVECIAKGKAHKRYEFGVKVAVATTVRGNLVVGARSFHGNPYDGHTLAATLEQTTILTGEPIKRALVDRGYKGVSVAGVKIIRPDDKRLRKSRRGRKLLGRRSAVEPVIGHMKQDGLLGRNFLKGELGDALNAILCAVGHNLRKLLRHFAAILFALLQWLEQSFFYSEKERFAPA